MALPLIGSVRVTRNRLTVVYLVPTFVAILAVASAPSSARADAPTERKDLVRLIHELDELEVTVQQAESAAVSTHRVRFQYAWLRADLEKIKAGIREYLDTAPTTPRAVPPLAGDYIR